MSVRVAEIYQDVVNVLLEPAGFQTLGIMSLTDFTNLLKDVMEDFLVRTGSIKKLVNIPSQFGVSTYPEPDNIMEVQAVHFDNAYVYESSGWFQDYANSQWQSDQGFPERWREDELPPKSIELGPTPVTTGRQVTPTPPNPGYGQIAAVSNTNDFGLLGPAAGGYGVINGFSGILPGGVTSAYANAINPGYGTVAIMCASNTNLQLVATVQPTSYPQTLYDYIAFVPDSFTPYLKYGVLEKIFTGDGEYKDNSRAAFCRQVYTQGVNMTASLMQETGVE